VANAEIRARYVRAEDNAWDEEVPGHADYSVALLKKDGAEGGEGCSWRIEEHSGAGDVIIRVLPYVVTRSLSCQRRKRWPGQRGDPPDHRSYCSVLRTNDAGSSVDR
jgi:hypothetical protein